MRRVFYGWWLVLATAVLSFYTAGAFFYGFAAFFKPIMQDLGLSYAATSLAYSLQRLEGGIMAPVVGFLVDRFGPRKLVFVGSAVVGIGFILLSQVNSLLTYYGAFVVLSAGFGATSYGISNVVVANWFRRKVGRALGLMALGVGFCGIMVVLLVWVIAALGWRNTLILLALGMWAVGFPVALVLRRRPEEYGLLPDGEAAPAPQAKATPPEEVDFSVAQALRTRAFWMLTVATTVLSAAHGAVFVHIIAYLTDVGISNELAGLSVMFITLLSLVGRLGLGWLSDLWDRRLVFAFALALQAVGVLLFAFIQEPWHLVPFLLIFSPGYGGLIPLRPALQREYFGRRAFGAIHGLILGLSTFGGIAAPVFAGWMRDVSGSYRLAFIIIALVALLGVPAILAARRPEERKALAQGR